MFHLRKMGHIVCAILATLETVARGQPTAAPTEAGVTLKIGFMASLSTSGGSDSVAAFLTASQLINADPERYLGNSSMRLQPYFHASVSFGDDYKLGPIRSISTLVAKSDCHDPFVEDGVNGSGSLDVHAVVLGGGSSDAVRTSPIAEIMSKPVVALSATSDDLSDKSTFPVFSRVVAPDKYQAQAMATIANSLGWDRVGVLYSKDSYGTGLRDQFVESCEELGLDVVARVGVTTDVDVLTAAGQSTVRDIAETLQKAFERANVRVYLLAAGTRNVYTALSAANRSGVIGPGYALLLPDGVTSMRPKPEHAALEALLHGALGLFPDFNVDSSSSQEMLAQWPTTPARWSALLAATGHQDNAALSALQPTSSGPVFVWANYAFDATMFTAKAIAGAWADCADPSSATSDLQINCALRKIRATTHNGTSGEIRLDASGDRSGAYGIFNVVNGTRVRRGRVDVEDNASASVQLNFETLIWSDGVSNRSSGPQWGQSPATTAVPDTEEDGSTSERTPLAILVSLVVVVILLFAFLVAAVTFREYVKRKKLRPTDFRKVISHMQKENANVATLDFRKKDGQTNKSSDENGVALEDGKAVAGDLNLPEELRRSSVEVAADVIGKGQFGSVQRGHLTTNVGRVRARLPVAIKVLNDTDHQDRFAQEAALTWQFRHPNIVQMHGVVTSGFPHFLVLELCEQGELLNYVQQPTNHSAKHLLDILLDIAKGMEYLASTRFVHRDLACRNVLLDATFHGKICDFGLGRATNNDEYYRVAHETVLPIRWTDPWAIQHQVFSEATDVWSFGVTAIEMFQKGERPYGTWQNLLVLESIQNGYRLKAPPAMPPALYDTVVQRCWAPTPLHVKNSDEPLLAHSGGDRFMQWRLTFSEIVVGVMRVRSSLGSRCVRSSDSEAAAGYASGSTRHGDCTSGVSDIDDGPFSVRSSKGRMRSVYVLPSSDEEGRKSTQLRTPQVTPYSEASCFGSPILGGSAPASSPGSHVPVNEVSAATMVSPLYASQVIVGGVGQEVQKEPRNRLNTTTDGTQTPYGKSPIVLRSSVSLGSSPVTAGTAPESARVVPVYSVKLAPEDNSSPLPPNTKINRQRIYTTTLTPVEDPDPATSSPYAVSQTLVSRSAPPKSSFV